jgi:hypothetical protein
MSIREPTARAFAYFTELLAIGLAEAVAVVLACIAITLLLRHAERPRAPRVTARAPARSSIDTP